LIVTLLSLSGSSDNSNSNFRVILSFMGATLLSPIVNFGFFMRATALRRKHLIPVYGIASVVSVALVLAFLFYLAKAFHKIGG
jgi:hypothetical protein